MPSMGPSHRGDAGKTNPAGVQGAGLAGSRGDLFWGGLTVGLDIGRTLGREWSIRLSIRVIPSQFAAVATGLCNLLIQIPAGLSSLAQ